MFPAFVVHFAAIVQSMKYISSDYDQLSPTIVTFILFTVTFLASIKGTYCVDILFAYGGG